MSDPNLRRPGALGEAFGLAGRLPRRTTTGAGSAPPAADLAPSPAPAPVENVEGGTAVEQPASTRAEPVSAAVVHTPAVEADETDVTFQVSVYVLPAVSRAIEEARRRTGRTNAEIAYDAIDAVRDRLPELVAARRGGDRPAGSLFPGRRSRTPRAAAAAEGRRRLWSLQATAAELAVIDGLVETTGARSRSELISCAVEAHFGRRRRSR